MKKSYGGICKNCRKRGSCGFGDCIARSIDRPEFAVLVVNQEKDKRDISKTRL